ncbi:MAG: hypothetical protein ACLVJ6_00240 [Merdibacter sp.]
MFLVVCFALFPTQDPIALASLAMFSVTVGELASCICMLCHLRFSFHHIRIAPRVLSRVRPDQLRDILSISMPMMGSRLSGSLTYFLEPICMLLLVPASMSAQIVEGYGILNGYTLPLLTMPSFLSITLSNYLLPSFSYAIAHHQKKQAKKSCLLILTAVCCSGSSMRCSATVSASRCFSSSIIRARVQISCMYWPCPSCSTACSPRSVPCCTPVPCPHRPSVIR